MKKLRLGGRNAFLVQSFSIEFLGVARFMISLGFGFFALIYLIIATLLHAPELTELEPTLLSIEIAENVGFPDRAYFKVTGGNVVFSEAQIALAENKANFRTITVPVISDALWSAWQERKASGKALNARPVRLLVDFEAKGLAVLWSGTKEEADQSFDLVTLKMDVTGRSEAMQETWVDRKQLAYLTETIDWDQLHVLDFKPHDRAVWNFVKKFGTALGLAAISAFVLLYRRPKQKLKVGDTYRFMAR